MNAFEDHARMLDDLHEEQKSANLSFTWDGSDWDILPGSAKFGRKNDFGGLALSCDLQLTCTTAQFGDTLPDAGQTIFYLNLEYTIKTVATPPGANQICIQADLNAGEK